MKNKKIVLSLILLICVCLSGVLLFKNFLTTKPASHRNITNLENAYNADDEVTQALERMKNSSEKANVIVKGNSGQRLIALTFDGLTERTTVQRILDLLKKYDAKATFFVDGVQTAEDPQSVVNIRNEGHKIENYTFSGMVKMEKLSAERLILDFCRAQKIIKVTTDRGPSLLKCNDTKYTEQVLKAAKACGFNSVVTSTAFLNVKQINALTTADEFVGSIKPGSIVSVKLKTNTQQVVNEPGKTDSKPAIDKQPGLRILSQPVELEEKEIVDAVEKLLISLKKASYTTIYVENFAINAAQSLALRQDKIDDAAGFNVLSYMLELASVIKEEVIAMFTGRTAYAAENIDNRLKEIKIIPTTEPALAFTFGGLTNETVVNDVLSRLNYLGIKATFFVTEAEMKKYPETVRKIISNGHEMGIAIKPRAEATLEETIKNIERNRKMLQDQFGVSTSLIKQPWGNITDTTREAVAVLNCKLIGQSIYVVQSKHKDYTFADQVMPEIFGKYTTSLARGQIIYFRMDYYTNERLVGDLIETIKKRKVDNIAYVTSFDNPANNQENDSQYTIKPVGEILNNTGFVYQYPLDPASIPDHLRNNGHGININQHNFLDEAAKRYIGNEEVDYEDRMFGFSKMDTRRLDVSGLIHTKENVVFLTFDDWGTDASLNKILYVLRKHNVPGTFFVITNNVWSNPNLLRTIAMQGHDIGSHSDKHKAMVIRDPKTDKLIQTQEKAEYVKELGVSYTKLLDITGDVNINGKPALTRFFRPPTLAISKVGMEALLETGYEYIINGSCSTEDYQAENVTQLVRKFEDGLFTKYGEVKKGAILIMHMGDAEVYTAAALDILLTANEAKADSDPSKFKVGRLSDFLTAGYSQLNRKFVIK
jgi:peptidoglycan/xylan/chitin deacetylase (PgdA/CDA1 family)